MKKTLLCTILGCLASVAFADTIESAVVSATPTAAPAPVAVTDTNPNAGFIGRYNYFQNPYGWMMSGGGTLHLTESQIEQQNWAEKLFAGGTYNVFAGATYNQWDGSYASAGKSYGANIFAQTGQIGGFSLGGVVSIMNPVGQLNDQVNPIRPGTNVSGRFQSIYIPTFTSLTLPEAFIEYQYKNVVNADLGYVAFDNSPWLSGNMYTNMLTVPTTYQGIGVNVYAGNGWVLSALGFNAAEFGAEKTGFTGQTNYTSWINSPNAGSNGTAALGAQYTDNSGNYNARMWGYQFDNYGTLLYGDGSINFPVKGTGHSFNLGAQFATSQQWFQSSNAMNTSSVSGAGNIQAYATGVKAGWAYDQYMWQLNLSANTMWGPSNAWQGGAIVSPYTQSLQVDPLYSEAWSYNMVTSGQPGNMYKAQAQFALGNWGQNLIFQPVYVYVANNNPNTNGLQELDLVMNYPLPQVRGLYLFGVYAQQWYSQSAVSGAGAPSGSGGNNGNYQPIEIQAGIYYTW